ncbi:hypothetical protein Ciccas_001765 [Cichlidogyrus casuarinus]|uniref:Uncharacterized protein n=1 Tax=Cichlidogyrus casuarinus TaxID=1844966 RepID=A0ABD2QJ39_9PLAT
MNPVFSHFDLKLRAQLLACAETFDLDVDKPTESIVLDRQQTIERLELQSLPFEQEHSMASVSYKLEITPKFFRTVQDKASGYRSSLLSGKTVHETLEMDRSGRTQLVLADNFQPRSHAIMVKPYQVTRCNNLTTSDVKFRLTSPHLIPEALSYVEYTRSSQDSYQIGGPYQVTKLIPGRIYLISVSS